MLLVSRYQHKVLVISIKIKVFAPKVLNQEENVEEEVVVVEEEEEGVEVEVELKEVSSLQEVEEEDLKGQRNQNLNIKLYFSIRLETNKKIESKVCLFVYLFDVYEFY